MHQVDDLHRLRRHAIDQDIVGVHHRLARARHAAGPVHGGVRRQPLGARFDRGSQPLGRGAFLSAM